MQSTTLRAPFTSRQSYPSADSLRGHRRRREPRSARRLPICDLSQSVTKPSYTPTRAALREIGPDPPTAFTRPDHALVGHPGSGIGELGDGALGDDAQHLLLSPCRITRDQCEPGASLIERAVNRVERGLRVNDDMAACRRHKPSVWGLDPGSFIDHAEDPTVWPGHHHHLPAQQRLADDVRLACLFLREEPE